MMCEQYKGDPGGDCPRKAKFTVGQESQPKLALCPYHAHQTPLKLVLSDFVKWGKWIKVDSVTHDSRCQIRRGCEHSYGNSFKFKDGPGPAVFTVDGGKPLCRYHTEMAVWDEALFGDYLPRLIVIEPFPPRNDVDANE